MCDKSSFITSGLSIYGMSSQASRNHVEFRFEEASQGFGFVQTRGVQQGEDELLGFQLARDGVFLHAVAQNRFDFVEGGQASDERAKLRAIGRRIGAKNALITRLDGLGE